MEPSNFRKRMLKLAEAHKKEEDKLNLRIIQLQTKLKDKQCLELEIEGMSSGVEDMIPIFEVGGGDGDADSDAEAKKKIVSLEANLKEKDEHIADLEELNEALMIKERKMKDEFQYARKVLIDKEKHQLNLRILQLQKKLDAKQRLELEIEQMSGGVESMIPIFGVGVGDADADAKKMIESLKENLKDKAYDMKVLGDFSKFLLNKVKESNEELQCARKVLIDGLIKNKPNSKASIGVKLMGDPDYEKILAAAKKKYPADEAEDEAMEFTTKILNKLKDQSWYPVKNIKVGEESKEVVDEEDDFLKDIKKEWGAEVYNALLTALTEINEYNPGGRCPVPELWNFAQGRRATLGECVGSIVLRLSKYRKKK